MLAGAEIDQVTNSRMPCVKETAEGILCHYPTVTLDSDDNLGEIRPGNLDQLSGDRVGGYYVYALRVVLVSLWV